MSIKNLLQKLINPNPRNGNHSEHIARELERDLILLRCEIKELIAKYETSYHANPDDTSRGYWFAAGDLKSILEKYDLP